MPYRLVEGEVRLLYHSSRHVGSRPDGDSAWFRPDNPDLLEGIGYRNATLNKGGFAQLRFEGIDALELHYPGSHHQMAEPAVNARNFMLEDIGFEPNEVEYAPRDNIPTYVRDSNPISVRTHILTRAIDPYGRPVAFVFAGKSPERSGSDIFLDEGLMDTSLNSALLKEGWVYPAFYSARIVAGERVGGLPGDLRAHLAAQAIQAQTQDIGVWSHDTTTKGFQIITNDDIYALAIWPKIYRRLAKFFDDDTIPHDSMEDFIAWLHDDRHTRDDRILVLEIGEILNLSDLLETEGNMAEFSREPSQLVVIPR